MVSFHGCRGYGNAVWRIAARLAGQGYLAVTPDNFARPGKRSLCRHRTTMNSRRMRQREEDIRHTVAQLRHALRADLEQIALLGISEGGGGASWSQRQGC